MIERTLSIIKPNTVKDNIIGEIEHRIERAGFRIVAMKMLMLTREQAEGFYAEHQTKPFFKSLVNFMVSYPVIIQVLEGENAVCRYRELMGATDPKNAATGTLRADYAKNQQENSVHGSDSCQSAAREIAYFFADDEICHR